MSDNNLPATTDPAPPVLTTEEVPTSPKKKLGGKKLIPIILGLSLLVGGIVAGVALVKQQQDIRDRAAPPTDEASCKGCSPAGYTWVWKNGECKATEARCGPTPIHAVPTPGAQTYCSGNTCDVTDDFPGCYINHYLSDNRNDQTITDILYKRAVPKSSLGARNCGAEQIDVSCNNESLAKRYTQDCVEAETPKPTKTGTPKPTPTKTPKPTPTKTPTPPAGGTPTPTTPPGATPTPTPTPPSGETPTPTSTPGATPTPTTPPIALASPTPTTATPQVPVAGTGPSVLGATVIAAGMLLLLLGLVF